MSNLQVVVGPNITVAQGTRLMSEPQKDDWDDPNLSFGADDTVSEKSFDATVVDSHGEAITLFVSFSSHNFLL